MRIGVSLPGSFFLLCLGAALFPAISPAQTSFSGGSIAVNTTVHTSTFSTAAVSGIANTVTDIKITLNLNVTHMSQVALALKSPGGTVLDIASAICDFGASVTLNLTDTASSLTPGGGPGCTTTALNGTFKAADYLPNADTFNSPGPGGSGTYVNAGDGTNGTQNHSILGTFGQTGTAMNGTWTLYMADQANTPNTPSGSITSWSITFTTSGGVVPTNTTLNAGSPNPSFTSGTGSSVSWTAHVSKQDNSGPATNGNVTLHDNTTNTDLVTSAINASGDVTLTATITTEGVHSLVATYLGGTGFTSSQPSNSVSQTVNVHPTITSGQACVNGTIAIPKNGDPGVGVGSSAYPSQLLLSGTDLGSSVIIQKVTVQLNNLNYDDLAGLGMLLKGPNNKVYEFMAASGGTTGGGSNRTLTFDDTAASGLQQNSVPATGTYKPTSNICNPSCNTPADPYQSPAPASFDSAFPFGTSTLAQEFGGANPNGTWQLFIANRASTVNPGSLGGWCLNFTLQTGANGTVTTVNSSPNPSTTGQQVTITASVTSTQTVTAGTVTFTDGLTTLGSATVSGGTASIQVSNLTEGTHHILASYGGTSTGTIFGVSSGTTNQRVNNTTALTITGSGVNQIYSYCNTGSIRIPGGTASQGPDGPYPSNIFVSQLPGTVKGLTLTFKNFTSARPDWLNSMVVGPNAVSYDFFSQTGPVLGVSGINLTFDDTSSFTAASIPTQTTVRPTSSVSMNTYEACPLNATDCVSPPVGPPAPTSPGNYAAPLGTAKFGSASAAGLFGGTTAATFQGGGNWYLYQRIMFEDANDGQLAGGWCLNFAPNFPDLTLTQTPMTHTPDPFFRGHAASFTITANNLGPGPSGGLIVVTDVLPVGLTFTDNTGSDAPWSCSVTSGTPATGQTVTCNYGTVSSPNILAANAGTTLKINVTVGLPPTTPANTINNAATLSGGGDVTPDNDTTTSGNITVIGTDLSITKTHVSDFFSGQTGATYTIKVHNGGPAPTNTGETITVTDSLPGIGDFTAITGLSGTNWNCNPPSSLTCTSTTTIPSGADSNPITLTVNVAAPPAHSQVTNQATVTAADDITPNNNTANDVTNLNLPPTISKSFAAAAIAVNGTTTLTITVTNPSTNLAALNGLAFTDTLPAGLQVNSTPGVVNGCSGTVTAVAGSGSISLSGGTVGINSSCTVAVTIKGITSGIWNNIINGAGTVSATNGGTGVASNTASLTVATPPTITKAFGVSSIALNANTSLSFTIVNPNAGIGLTGIAFTDNLPAGVVVATPNGISNTCNGTPTATAGGTSVSLTGGTIASGGNCVLTVNVTGTTAGGKNNTTGAVSSTESGAGVASNTATLTVVAPPSISKAFSPTSIATGATSTLSFTITNPNGAGIGLTGIAFTDTLPTGLTVAASPAPTNACNGTLTATSGTGAISLSAGTLAGAGATCIITVPVTSTTAGPAVNTTAAITSTEGGTGTTSNSATLQVVAPPTIAKSFSPAAIAVNATTTLTFTLTNPAANAVILTGARFADTLPTGLTMTNGDASVCGGTNNRHITGGNTVTLDATPIAVGGNCTFSVTVTGTTSGAYTNITGTVNSTNGGAGSTATANLTVATPPSIVKAFGASTIVVGGVTSLSFTVNNPNASIQLTGVGFTDTLPAGLVVATPNGLAGNTCNVTPVAVAASSSVSLTAATLAGGASCTFTVNVQGATAGAKVNSVQVTSTEGGNGNSSNSTVTVVSPPSIFKGFSPTSIPLTGGTSTLTFTVTNPNTATTLTGIGFTDTLPAKLTIATPNGLTTGCQTVAGSVTNAGTVTATSGTGVITLSGLGLNTTGGKSCIFSVNVTGVSAGQADNTTAAPTSTEGGTGVVSNTATLQVVAPPSIAKSFNPTSINVGATTTLSLTISNPAANATTLTGVAVTDVLPSGLTVPNSSPATVCSTGSLSVTGSNTITLTGLSLAQGAICQINFTVTGTTAGNYTNTTGTVSSTNGGTGSTASATLAVAQAPSIVKAFGAQTISVGGSTTLSFSITNPNSAVQLTGVGFTDTLPSGLVVASPSGLTGNSCNVTPTAVAGSGSVSLTGATLAASASCTFTVNVTSTTAGAKVNSVQVTSTEGGNGNISNATVTVVSPPAVQKSFGVSSIPLSGGTATLTFTVTNPNTATTLTNIGFTDTLPANLTVASPNGLTGGCLAVAGSVSAAGNATATPGNGTISITGLGLNTTSTKSCTFSVNVTGTAAGPANNTTGAPTSTEGGTGVVSNTATLQVLAPPSIAKSFNPTSINVGATTTLSVTISNPSPNAATLTGVGFTDVLPTGLTVPNSSPATVCSTGSLSVTGSNTITLTGLSLAQGAICQINFTVTGTTAGNYTNTTGNVSSTNGGTGATASASLTVAAPPSITKVFGVPAVTLGLGTTLSFTIVNPNATVPLTNVSFTDNMPAGLIVSSIIPGNTCDVTPTAVGGSGTISFTGATLAANSGCGFTVNILSTSQGAKSNSVQVTSAQGTGNTSTANIFVVGPPVLAKSFNSASIPLPGGSSTLTFTITNPNVGFSLGSIGFTDGLPAKIKLATPSGLTQTGCLAVGGSVTTAAQVTATDGGITVGMSNLALSGSGSCTFSVNVVGVSAGEAENQTSTITSLEGGTGLAATASLTVVAPPNIAKSFSPTSVNIGGTTTLTITISNPAANTVSLTGVAVTDVLPSGLSMSNGTASACGGTTTVTGGNTVTLTGATIASQGNCQISFTVTGTTAGNYTNTTGAVTSTNGGTGSTATANLSVAMPPGITKTFGALTIPVGGTTTLAFTVTNPNTVVQLNGVGFTDTLPAGLVVATPNGLTGNTCNVTPTAVAGSGSISLTGATINVSNGCNFTVNVTGSTAGVKNNSVQVTSTEGGTGNISNATLTVLAPPAISKAFGAASIPLSGSTTTLSFTLSNPNSANPLTGIAFSDNIPANLVISTPNGLTGTCQTVAGTVTAAGSITATQGTNAVSLSGLGLAASGACIFSVNVSGASAGAANNVTGNVTSSNGGTGLTATANIAVVAPPVISKAFNPTAIAVGSTTQLTFSIVNPAANTVSLTGVAFSDTLPTGLSLTNGTASVCGGSNNLAITGGNLITMTSGTIATGGNCSFSVTVTGNTSGSYTNTTGSVTSTNGGTGNTGTANLTVAGPPVITKAFGAGQIALNTSTTLTFTISNPAVNTFALTGVGFTDSLPSGLVVAATPGLQTTCSGTPAAVAASGAVSLTGATIATNSSCTLSVNVTGTSAGAKLNSVVATSAEGGAGSAGTASITVVAPPAIVKTFSVASIALNGNTTLSFSISNPNTATTLTGIALTDGMPAGLTAASPTTSGTCTGLSLGGTSSNLTVSGLSLAANTFCIVNYTVTGSTAGDKVNTTSTVSSNEGGAGTAGTATLKVVAPPSITKAFTPSAIAIGATTSLSFTITNPGANTLAESGVAFSDSLPAGLSATTTSAPACNGGTVAVSTSSGITTIALTGGSIPVSSTCSFSVTVTGNVAGQYTNTTGSVSSTNGGTGNTATANLSVAAPPTITKAFSLGAIALNGTAALNLTVTNPNSGSQGLSGISFTDNLPAGLVVATPNGLGGTCSTVSAPASGTSITLSGGSLAAGTSCSITVAVKGIAAGAQLNTTGAISATESGAGATSNTATLVVVAQPVISKAFGAGSIPLNGTTSLVFTVSNPSAGTVLSNLSFTDNLPGGLIVATPNGLSGNCLTAGGSVANAGAVTAVAGSTIVSLTSLALTPASACTFSVSVTGVVAGQQANTSGNVTATFESGAGPSPIAGNSASANIAVVAPPVISKSFLSTTALPTLSFTITNPGANAVGLTGVGFNDTFPAGMTVATPNGLAGSCGSGVITAVAGTNSVSLTGANIAAGGNCVFSVAVSTSGGQNTYTNITDTVTSTNGGTGNAATAIFTQGAVGPGPGTLTPPSISKAFGAATIPLNGTTTLSFTVSSPFGNAAALTGIAFSDPLPGGILVATPSGLTGSCGGGTINATAGSNSVSLFGATLSPGTNCTFTVNVIGPAPGAFVNTTTAVTSSNGGSGNAATASLTVSQGPDLTIAKAHTGGFAQGAQGLTYTLTVTNSGGSTTSGTVTVTDTIPSGLTLVSMAGQGWTCGSPNAANVCTRSDGLNGGASYPAIIVTVNVDAGAPPSVTNQATVSGGSETNTSNNSASDVTAIGTNGNVTGQVMVTVGPPPGGAVGLPVLNVTVKNITGSTINGPVQVVLSGGPALINQITNETGSFNGNPYFTATTGPLAPGASVTFAVQFIFIDPPPFTTTVYSGPI